MPRRNRRRRTPDAEVEPKSTAQRVFDTLTIVCIAGFVLMVIIIQITGKGVTSLHTVIGFILLLGIIICPLVAGIIRRLDRRKR